MDKNFHKEETIMNLKRIMAGVLAGSMALAMAVPAFADEESVYSAYLGFQTPSYSFRNACDDATYGIEGTSGADYSEVHAWDDDNNLTSAAGTFTDVTFTGDGTYTVSVSGLDWDSDEFGTSTCYNLIFLSTSIPVSAYNSTDFSITIDEVTIGGSALSLDEDLILSNYDDVLPDDEATTGIQLSIQNIWNDNADIGYYDITASEMTITFTVSGLDSVTDAPVVAATTGDVAPVAALMAFVAVAGVAMVASKKARVF